MNRKILSFVLLAASLAANAQEDTSTVNTLDAVTVTALRTQQKVLAAPRSVTVITAADIQKLAYQNLADLLQRFEGMYIPGTHQAPGSLQSIYLRGADSRQVLVMIDGIKLSDNSSPDNALDFSEVSTADIERIEIVRGSQGTLYGNSAVGGVINIITKKGSAKKWKSSATLRAGNYGEDRNSIQAQAGVTYTDRSGIFAGGELYHYSIDGMNAAANPNNGIFFIGEDDDFTKTDVSVKTGLNRKGWDAYLSYRGSYQQSDIDDGPFQDDENYVINTRRNLLTYGVGKKISETFSARVFGGYTRLRRHNYDDSSITVLSPLTYDRAILDGAYTGKNFTNELQMNYAADRWKLVGGVGYLTDKMNVDASYYNYAFGFGSDTNYDTVGIKSNTAFGYMHADHSIPFNTHVFHLAGGTRFTNHSRFGNFLTWEFTPSLLISRTASLYISYSTGFNAPSLYQLFAPERDFGSSITRGFADLQPEESRSIELGTKINFKNKASIRVSVYHNQVDNTIDYVYLWDGTKDIATLGFADYRGDTYLNVGRQVNKGIEAGFDIYLGSSWELHSNVSYNDGTLKYEPSLLNRQKTQNNHVQLYSNGAFLNTTVEDKTVRRPSLISNSSVVYKLKDKWRFAADARHVGKRRDLYYDWTLGPFGALGKSNVADYTLFNLSAAYKPNRYLSVTASVFNILGREYTELNGLTTRPRYGELSVQFTL